MALGSIGVVYGDIGTSPLYALREAVTAATKQGASGTDAVLGILSLIVWTMLLIVTLKYVLVLLNADNKGEGGTFALMALGQSVAKRSSRLILVLGVVGAAFFYGDAVITPAISVLSAVEGLKLAAPQLERVMPQVEWAGWLEFAVLPITIVILVMLFAVQSRGTDKVARFFGPITLVWFVALAIGGLIHIVDDVRVFQALNPWLGVHFVLTHGVIGLAVMGLIFLVVTGAEALYADLGHFGRKPIQAAWLAIVQPALILNYFGQGALSAGATRKPWRTRSTGSIPSWALIPMVVLATMATVIASQAVITGAFSFTRQAIQLGLMPRLEIRHTSESVAGQIYLPRVNQLLFVGVLIVTLIFRNSSDLAAAYGLSVTATMVIDSLMAFFVVWRCWNWPLWKAALLMVPLLLIEQAFLIANVLKIPEGGWLPLMVAALLCLVVLTWVRGSKAPDARDAQGRSRPRMAGAQARRQAAAPRTRNGGIPDRRPDVRADVADAQSQAQPRAARAQHHSDHQDRGYAARAAPRAHRDRARGRYVHSRDRALRFHGNAERAEDHRALPAQGPQHRHFGDVVLPVAPLAQDDHKIGDAPMAGTAVHLAGGQGRGCDGVLPHSERPGGGGGYAGDGLRGAGSVNTDLPWRPPLFTSAPEGRLDQSGPADHRLPAQFWP